jgi:pyruvate,water dikinase
MDPMDVEWAIDGLTNDLLLCKRPETIHSQRNPTTITEYKIEDENRHDKLLLKGIAVGDKIGSGLATILYSMDVRVSDGHEFIPGSILVTDMTDPEGTYYEKSFGNYHE